MDICILIQSRNFNRMKSFLSVIFTISIVIWNTSAHSQPGGDNIIGIYMAPKKDGKISIYKRGPQYFGKLVWGVKNFKDVKNPNARLRNRDVVGSDFMYGFEYDHGKYINGKIYDATSGRTYDDKMWLEGNTLKVRGYFGISALGRTETFARTDS